MSTTVQSVFSTVSYVMLEDAGLSLYVTQQDFLDIFRTVLLDWFEKTALVENVFTQTLYAGQAQYTFPDDVVNPTEAYWAGRYLQNTSLRELDQYEWSWSTRTGPPERWRMDSLAPKQMQVFPIPTVTGATYGSISWGSLTNAQWATLTNVEWVGMADSANSQYGGFYPADRNLTLIGTAGTLASSFSFGSTIPNVPDAFVPYLGYGVLANIFSTDGEAKDPQRAAYCQARFNEGINLARAYMAQEASGF